MIIQVQDDDYSLCRIAEGLDLARLEGNTARLGTVGWERRTS